MEWSHKSILNSKIDVTWIQDFPNHSFRTPTPPSWCCSCRTCQGSWSPCHGCQSVEYTTGCRSKAPGSSRQSVSSNMWRHLNDNNMWRHLNEKQCVTSFEWQAMCDISFEWMFVWIPRKVNQHILSSSLEFLVIEFLEID